MNSSNNVKHGVLFQVLLSLLSLLLALGFVQPGNSLACILRGVATSGGVFWILESLNQSCDLVHNEVANLCRGHFDRVGFESWWKLFAPLVHFQYQVMRYLERVNVPQEVPQLNQWLKDWMIMSS
ncbi:S ribonuclease [Pyrus ussuriensis x Pyrus communis]|uniref:S ribonuclease n=1 Tax=Pyrus ussuriensis x Pyrus communis TaxID=2448454 RepID=A0A5N5FJ34_9ROSA|nr:S ribonuclease [Pyrus ussuriensis x Pyrus communis]